jgi:peptidyl-prolyl cis-trans isomerase D
MLKSFWEHIKDNFKTDVIYDVSYIVQNKVSKDFPTDKLMQYYKENKTHFRDKEGKIVAFEDAKKDVEVELNKKATKDQALRGYINFKKGKTDKSEIKTAKISNSQNPFNVAVLEAVSKVSANKPFLKPIEVDGIYYTFKLEKINPAKTKSFKEAKADVLPIYVEQMRAKQVVATAEKSLKTFKGDTTEFLTALDQDKLTKLSKTEAGEFLQKLFMSSKKRSYIELDDGKVVLYDILEQKMLKSPSETKEADVIVKLKDAVFNEGLIKTLQSKYKTEIFIQGL